MPENQIAKKGQVNELNRILAMPTVKERFESVLGDNAGAFVASIVEVFASDDYLQQCDPNTVVMESLKAATLNLPISKNLGFAYIVPYKGRATFQMGYKGFIQLAMRTGQYRYINTDVVYTGELIKYDKLTGDVDLTGTATSSKPVGYFAYIETINGFRKVSFWTVEQIMEHARKYSQSLGNKNGPWAKHFDEMAKKTVLKHLLSKYGIMSVQMVQAFDNETYDAEFDEQDQAEQEHIDMPEQNQDESKKDEPQTVKPGF